jgi:head-tail adaptor
MSLGTDSVLDTLIHDGLLDSIPRAYLAVVDIQVNTPTQNPDGEEVDSWANHSTMVNLSGTLAKSITTGQEQRRQDLTISRSTLILDLAGYYPDITDTNRVSLTTPLGGRDEVYNIMQVLHDSQARQTRLELEEVSH